MIACMSVFVPVSNCSGRTDGWRCEGMGISKSRLLALPSVRRQTFVYSCRYLGNQPCVQSRIKKCHHLHSAMRSMVPHASSRKNPPLLFEGSRKGWARDSARRCVSHELVFVRVGWFGRQVPPVSETRWDQTLLFSDFILFREVRYRSWLVRLTSNRSWYLRVRKSWCLSDDVLKLLDDWWLFSSDISTMGSDVLLRILNLRTWIILRDFFCWACGFILFAPGLSSLASCHRSWAILSVLRYKALNPVSLPSTGSDGYTRHRKLIVGVSKITSWILH